VDREIREGVNRDLFKTPLLKIGRKKFEYYGDFLIKADNRLHDQVFSLLAARVPPPARVLDFGAGEGSLSQRLADAGYDVLSVDVEPSNFKATTDFEALDFDDYDQMGDFRTCHHGEFDAVVSVEIVEHLENVKTYLQTAAALSKPGASIVLSTPNVTSWLSRVTFYFAGTPRGFMEHDFQTMGHINPISSSELERLLGNAGWLVRQVVSGGLLPRVWITRSPALLVANALGVLSYPFMKGLKDGWCVIAVGSLA
jgi:2-polyprenyl-3-methyl-5-hydroxy-6-metoxy-1,4-benzoquinol methylase